MSLWNDTFRIELVIKQFDSMGSERKETLYFKGSLKNAIYSILRGNRKGHVCADFYTSDGCWLKEIMF